MTVFSLVIMAYVKPPFPPPISAWTMQVIELIRQLKNARKNRTHLSPIQISSRPMFNIEIMRTRQTEKVIILLFHQLNMLSLFNVSKLVNVVNLIIYLCVILSRLHCNAYRYWLTNYWNSIQTYILKRFKKNYFKLSKYDEDTDINIGE